MFCFLVISTSFTLFWPIQSASSESLIKEASGNVRRDYKDVFRTSPTKRIRSILLWTRSDYAPFYWFGEGQSAFLKNKCAVTECYVTTNRNLFGNDITKFDAIAFNGRNMQGDDLPNARSPHQRYIFFNMESSDNYPECDARFDSFFNWTSTYRLNSDIPYPYILIRDKKGEIVGPKPNMKWEKNMGTVDTNRIGNKTRAAAWFASNCHTRSGREKYVRELQAVLKWYDLTVDVYGECGTFRCDRTNQPVCRSLLKNDYFFYMAMENSFADDYVTEKLLKALHNDVVPIVYGGADYSRFLPPGSYIDARQHTVVEMAAMIKKLMHSPKEYSQYFAWQNNYTYHSPESVEDVCAICIALHDEKMMQELNTYGNFRYWWNPYHESRCLR